MVDMDENPYSAPQTRLEEIPAANEWQHNPLSLVAIALLMYVVLPSVNWLICFLLSLIYV
jgi:hypothetical protein